MTLFGDEVVEALARLLCEYDSCEYDFFAGPWGWDESSQAAQDQYRVEAATMLAKIGSANREHLTRGVARAMAADVDDGASYGDELVWRDAERIVASVYGDKSSEPPVGKSDDPTRAIHEWRRLDGTMCPHC